MPSLPRCLASLILSLTGKNRSPSALPPDSGYPTAPASAGDKAAAPQSLPRRAPGSAEISSPLAGDHQGQRHGDERCRKEARRLRNNDRESLPLPSARPWEMGDLQLPPARQEFSLPDLQLVFSVPQPADTSSCAPPVHGVPTRSAPAGSDGHGQHLGVPIPTSSSPGESPGV